MPGVHVRRSAFSLLCLALSGGATVAVAATPGASGSSAGAPADTMPVRPTPPPPPVAYTCDDGTKIIARFPDSSLAMLIIGDDRYELTSVIAASGVRYTGGSVEFWTHQGKARFTRQDKTTECREANAATPEAPGGPKIEAPGKTGN